MSSKPYTIQNCVAQNKAYPDTFEIPSKETLDDLRVGDMVKLIFNCRHPHPSGISAERMWVQITSMFNGKMKGTISNKSCLFPKSLRFGATVEFRAINIAATMDNMLRGKGT